MDCQLRVLAFFRAASTSKGFIFNNPKLVSIVERKFLICRNVTSSKESDSRKFQILVIDINLDGYQIRVTRVIDKASNISVSTGIDAIGFTVLKKEPNFLILNQRNKLCSYLITLLSKSKRYESSSRWSASKSVMISPTYLRNIIG